MVCRDCLLSGQVDELSAKYQAVSIEEVEEGWKDVYERSLTSCMHGAACQQGPSCQVSVPASDLCPFEGASERLTHYKILSLDPVRPANMAPDLYPCRVLLVFAAYVLIHQIEYTADSWLECAWHRYNLQCGLHHMCM